MSTLKIAVISNGKTEFKEIPRTLDALQREVGGFIEYAPITDSVVVYVNEEGKLNSLPPTAAWMHGGKLHDMLVGPVVVCGPTDEDGNETDLTPEAFDTLKPFLRILPPQ